MSKTYTKLAVRTNNGNYLNPAVVAYGKENLLQEATSYVKQKGHAVLLFFIALIMTAMTFSTANAQITITIGAGSSISSGQNVTPYCTFYHDGRHQYIFTPAEITGVGGYAGNITSLAFNVQSLGSPTMDNFNIKLGHTTLSAFVAADLFVSPLNTVYSAATYQPAATGFQTINFTIPFTWNGTDNLVVDVCYDNGSFSSNFNVYQDLVVSGNVTKYAWADGQAGCVFGGNSVIVPPNTSAGSNGVTNLRPQVQLGFAASFACAGTPAPGNAVTTASNVCPNVPFNLYISNSNLGTGMTYQWQKSPTIGGTYTNIGGATSSFLNTSQTATSFYRCITTCTNSGLSATATAVGVTSPLLVSGTYTINSAVITGGTNFQTFADAVNFMACGINGPVTFNVSGGPYAQQILIPDILGASAINTITFNGGGVTLNPSITNANQRSVITLNGADYVTLSNFNIVPSLGTYGNGVTLHNGSHFNTITGCTITNTITSTSTFFNGIVFTNSVTNPTTSGGVMNNNTISNNTIIGGYYPISMMGDFTTPSSNNTIINNTIRDGYLYQNYIAYQNNLLVKGNDISRAVRTTTSTFYGIYVWGSLTASTIDANRIHNANDNGTTLTGTYYCIWVGIGGTPGNENYVTNNAIYDIKNYNGTLYGIYHNSGGHLRIFHNSISLDNTLATGTVTTTRGIWISTTTAINTQVKNNIVTIKRGGTGAKHGFYNSSTGAGNVISDNNDIFISAPAPANFGYWGADRATLAAWQTASGQDANSYSADPLFTNANLGNMLPLNAVLNNAGAPAGVAFDLLGTARSATQPDIGAIEFAVAGLDAGINWVAPVNPVGAGPATVIVNIANTQTTLINSVTITYTDGLTPVQQTFTGLGLAGGANTNLSFTTPFVISGIHSLSATINTVNGIADDVAGNNFTSPITVCPALMGAYTINAGSAASATNFTSFTTAVAAMANCGIAGPVTFNVIAASGPYNEQITIPVIVGTSGINTITFNGNGNTMAFSSNDGNKRSVILIDGGDYITFNNLIVDATGAGTYGWGIQLTNGADFCTISGCTVTTNAISTSTFYSGIVISGSLTSPTTTGNAANNVTILNNTITGGYYGLTHLGTGTTSYTVGNIYQGNTIVNPYFYGMYLYYQDAPMVINNDVTLRQGVGYGLYTFYMDKASVVSGNKFKNFGTYGIYLSTTNSSLVGRPRIVNNMISANAGTPYGIYMVTAREVDVYYNSINLGAGTGYGVYVSSATSTNIDLRNNSIAHTGGGYAMYISATSSMSACNYNNYYTTATNFVYYGGIKADLAALQATNAPAGNDLNSYVGNPLYDAPHDLHVTGPQLNAKATPIAGITTDIDGQTRNATTPDIGADEYTPIPFDLSMVAFVTPTTGGCFSAVTPETVTLRVKSFGTDPVDYSVTPLTLTVNVTGGATQTMTLVVNSGSIAPLATQDIAVGTINLGTQGVYNFTASLAFSTDGDATNNSITGFSVNSQGPTPEILASAGDTRCGIGPVTLTASATAGSQINWYDAPSAGTLVGTGPSITPTISANKTYWVQAAVGGTGANSLTTTFAGGNGFDGNMFDIVALNQVTIMSFAGNFNAGTGIAEVWYRPGSYAGFTNSNAGWTQAGSASVTSTGNGSGTAIPITVGVTIPAGSTYAFYVHFSGGVAYTNGTAVGNVYASDANIQFKEGHGGGYFALGNSPRVFNGVINYVTGCSSNRIPVLAVSNPAPPVVLTSSNPTSCEGDPVTLNASSPTNPTGYSYLWNNPSASTTQTVIVTPALPTTYVVTATDASTGCVDIKSVFIDVVAKPIVNITTSGTNWCDAANAQLNASAVSAGNNTVGTGTITNTNLSYPSPYGNWYWGARHQMLITAADMMAGGLTAGTINSLAFDVTNDNGAPVHLGFTISMKQTSLTAMTAWQTGMTTVYGPVDYPVGGTWYTGWNVHNFSTPFVWDGISNLIIETCFNNSSYVYNVSINQSATSYASTIHYNSDATGVCSNTLINATSNQRPNMQFGLTPALSYAWTGGTGLSSYSIANPVATPTAVTTYSATVTNSVTGCSRTESITINVEPTPTPVVTQTVGNNPLCLGQTATLVSGYTNPAYSYAWSNFNNQPSISVSAPGNYSVVVTTGVAGCVGYSTPFVLKRNVLSAVATVTSNYNGSQISCYGSTDGVITLAPTSLIVTPPVPSPGPLMYAKNGGTPQSSPIFTGLGQGNYTFTVTDTYTGCTFTSVKGTVEPPPVIVSAAVNNNVSCFGQSNGSATATASGGTGVLTYAWNTPIPKQTPTNNEMPAGTWTVTVTDANGCTATATVTITQPNTLTVTLGDNQLVGYGISGYTGCTTLNALTAGGTAPNTYVWTNVTASSALPSVTNAQQVCNPVGNTVDILVTYKVVVTDANGCTASALVTVNYVNVDCSTPGTTKIKVCHVPPGNQSACKTMCISPSAWPGLQGGSPQSYLGKCKPNCALPARTVTEMPVGLQSELNVYPNPTNGYLRIDYVSEWSEAEAIIVMDMQGRVVKEMLVQGGLEIHTDIDLAGLNNGIYFINVMNQGAMVKSAKVIKSE